MVALNKNKLGLYLVVFGLMLLAISLYRLSIGLYFQRVELAAMESEKLDAESPPLEPVFSEPVTEETEPAANKLPDINGILEIPEIDLKAVVIHGVTEDDLKRGPGFYPQSSHPERGNVSIAAHRGVYGSWFRHINRLRAGDEIYLTLGEMRYRYEVREQFVTHSRDWSVIQSNELAELTLTTCLFTTTTKRLIVKAELISVEKVKQPRRLENK